MFLLLPYRDDNPTRKFALINWCLIAANLWVFFAYQFPLTEKQQLAYYSAFGFIPASFFAQFSLFEPTFAAWEWATALTSMFSHGGILHLFGNLLFLYLYGDNVEDALGKVRYLLFYLLCGLGGAITQALTNPDSQVPMVGASGAISGVIAGYLLLYPRANVRVFYWLFLFIGTIYLPAYLVLGFWVFEQIIALPESMRAAGGVAIAAHLGGFVSGILLVPLLKRKEVRFFQKGHSRAFARNTRRIR